MCGRYFIDGDMWREIKKICKQIDDSKLKVTRGDVRPTDMAVVLMEMGKVHPEHMCWGFMSKYQEGLLINARAETVLSKPSFRDSIRHCRCVIPAAGFYEWNKANERVSFTMPQSKILYMAGIWQPTAKDNQFTILTTSPNASVLPVHDRMPLVLMPERKSRLRLAAFPVFWYNQKKDHHKGGKLFMRLLIKQRVFSWTDTYDG